MMGVSERGIALIKDFEGFGDTARYANGDPRRGDPYRCPAGVWTQGYGRTRGITEHSPRITEPEALAWLVEDVAEYARGVAAVLRQPATQNQFDAMVSLAFNVGLGWSGATKPPGARDGFRQSTVLRKFNAGDLAGAAEAFRLWNKAGGQVSPGLVRRRAREVALFTDGESAPMPQRVDEPVTTSPNNMRGPLTTGAGGGGTTVDGIADLDFSMFNRAMDQLEQAKSIWQRIGEFIAANPGALFRVAVGAVIIGCAIAWGYRRYMSWKAGT